MADIVHGNTVNFKYTVQQYVVYMLHRVFTTQRFLFVIKYLTPLFLPTSPLPSFLQ